MYAAVQLTSIARQVRRIECVEPTNLYRQVGVRLWGAGAYERETISGAETQYATFARLKKNDIVVNKIWARNGSVGVISDELDGCYGSSEFPAYEIDQSALLPRFFYWFTKTPMLWAQCERLSRGTSGQNRLKPENFLKIAIPLPPLQEQTKIVARLDDVQAKIEERRLALDAIERETRSMLFNTFQKIIEVAPWRPMSEIAPLNRRPVMVDPDREYPGLGARSFGRGLFHKPAVQGATLTWEQPFWIHEGDLVFSNIKAWEGAFGVAGPTDHMRVGSHRYLTCVPKSHTISANFLLYYLQTDQGLKMIGAASPGSADRNRTLGQQALMAIQVPVPDVHLQRLFDALCTDVERIREVRADAAKDVSALIPAMLNEVFRQEPSYLEVPPSSVKSVVPDAASQQSRVDSPFKEAVLVAAIVKAFHGEDRQPLGNFRLQKAVYFARRHMGESGLNTSYLRKAAGPYNPSMRYGGGITIATDKKWIGRSTGSFGEGSTLGSASAEMDTWITKYQFASAAAWVRDKFKFKSNDLWEVLATVDYAMLALGHAGATPTAGAILEFIKVDPEWRPKIVKLGLTEASIQNAMAELRALFDFGVSTRKTNVST